MDRRGIEFENNDTTPMEDVVDLLQFVFGHDPDAAFEAMVKIHKTGRAVVASVSEPDLPEVLERLDLANARLEHPLVYNVLADLPEEPVVHVNLSDLPTEAEWARLRLKQKIRSRYLVLVLLGIVVAAGLYRFSGL